MRSIVFLALAFSTLAVVGCRSTSNDRCERAIALLRAEKIDLEDKYYALETKYERLLAEAGYPEGYTIPRQFIQSGESMEVIDGRLSPPGNYIPNSNGTSTEELPDSNNSNNELYNESYNNRSVDLSPSSAEIPEITIDTGEFSVLDRSIAGPTRSPVTPTLQHPTPTQSNVVDNVRQTSPKRPTRRIQTLGETELASFITDIIVDCDIDEQRSAEAWLIVQPVDENRSAIPLRGEITVSLLDPSQQGTQQRIGLWKFSPARVATWIRDKEADIPGIHIPKPASIRFRDLSGMLLFVRYNGTDGQSFEASLDLDKNALVASREAQPGESSNSDSSDESHDAEWRPYR